MMLVMWLREGAQALLDALLVADVGIDPLEDAEPAALVGGDQQARLRHEREQADGLERDRLAAGVGAGDDDDVGIVVEIDVDGHDRFGVEQRVAGAVQVDHRAGVRELRLIRRRLPSLGWRCTGFDGWKSLITGSVASSA